MKKTSHTIKYFKSQSAIPAGVDGVFGGVAPSGKINMNFFVDCAHIPDFVNLEIDSETGRVIKSDHDRPTTISVREVVSCISLDLERAKSVYLWLGNKISEIENTNSRVK